MRQHQNGIVEPALTLQVATSQVSSVLDLAADLWATQFKPTGAAY